MLRVALIRIIYTAIMFLAGLVLSNLALPEKFGSISLLILNASLLSLITGFGADSMVVYKVSNSQWNTTQAFQFTWRTILVQMIILFFLESGSWFIFHQTFLSAEGSDYLLIDSIYFIGLVIVEKYLALLYSLNKSKAVNIILAVVASFYLTVLLLFYYFIKPGFVYILYLFAFESLVQAVALVVFFGVNHSRNLPLEQKEFWGAIKLSSIVMITNVVQLFAYRLDFWLLKYFYSSYEVGLYAQANKFANLSWIIPNIFAQLLLPKFARVDKTRTKDVLNTAFYFNLIILLVTILCTQFFYSFYLAPEYKDGLRSFYLMLPGYFFWASVIYFGAFVSAAGKFSYNLIASSLCFVLIFLADIILIPSYGIEGAAVANSLCYTAVFFAYHYILIKKFSFRWNELLWPRKRALLNVINFFTK